MKGYKSSQDIYQTTLDEFGFNVSDRTLVDKIKEVIKSGSRRDPYLDIFRETEFAVPVTEVIAGPLGYVPGKNRGTTHHILMSDGTIMTVGCFGAGRTYIRF